MEKQTKVVNKIKNSLVKDNAANLGTKKNDECYTGMQDILTEMSYWAELGKFQGKRIICPCDWDVTDDEEICAITIDYKEDGVEVTANNVYKTVKSVSYKRWVQSALFDDEEDKVVSEKKEFNVVEVKLAEDEIEDFLRNKLTCNFIKTFTQMARQWGIKSITASGYNPASGRGIPFQDVDYTQYDVCCTNPPFSLYSEFMKAVVGKIDFVILAPFMNRANPSIGVPLMSGAAFLGYGVHLGLSFRNPTTANAYHTKSVACDWIVSWPEAQAERDATHYTTGITYDLYKEDYTVMPNMTMKDGSHPIRVPAQYPDDYTGWMFGGVNLLDKLDQSVYEYRITHCSGYLNSHTDRNPFAHRVADSMTRIPGLDKTPFGGIVFRKKVQSNAD